MKTWNISIDKFTEYIKDKNVYIYGIGEVYQELKRKEIYRTISTNVVGYIDNGRKDERIFEQGKEYVVHDATFLKTIDRGIVLLCNIKYMEEMYNILLEEKLSDGIECFILPLIWTASDGKDDANVLAELKEVKNKENKIEKKIHSFWFSGEEKPKDYQKCIDSWKRVCPDYEIIEWDAKTYDCEKNLFVKQAFEKRKWAFVSDYARLDVIYNIGGIYLDMDVELLQNFEPLIKHKAFFNFGPRHSIDLGSGFGSIKNNPLIGTLLDFYKDKEFLDKQGKPMTDKYVQPSLLETIFPDWGIRMDGSMQLVDDMLILPRRFYTPLDDFLLQNFLQNEDTRGIHRYNAGWCSESLHEERKGRLRWVKVAENMMGD